MKKESPPTLKSSLRHLYYVIGGMGVFWLCLGAACGIGIAIVESLISALLSSLLIFVGVQGKPIHLPFGLNHLSENFSIFAILFICLGVIRGAMFFFINHNGNFNNENMLARLRLIAYYETFKSPKGYVSIADLAAKTSEHFQKATLFSLNAALAVPTILQSLVFFIFMAKTSWQLAFMGVGFISIAGFISFLVNKRVYRVISGLPAEYDIVMRQMTRMTRNWFLLRALRVMDREHDDLSIRLLNLTNRIVRSNFMGNVVSVLPATFGVVVIIILVMAQQKYLLLSGMGFLAFLYIFLRFVQCLGNLSAFYGNLHTYYPSFKRVLSYINSFSEEELKEIVIPAKSLSPIGRRRFLHRLEQRNQLSRLDKNQDHRSPCPEVHMEKVSFRYRKNLPWILSDATLTVPAGEAAAILGPSGSGKSTALALFIGLIKPERGQISIGGMSPDLYLVRSQVNLGYVGAEPYLIDGSVRENLLYGNHKSVTDEDIYAALKSVKLETWFKSVTDPLNYQISENGEGLSTGQKQRLMFARALLRNPQLLILDEVSANLDEKTESELAELIKSLNGRCTVIIVTHRPALIKYVDLRMVLRNTDEDLTQGLPNDSTFEGSALPVT